MSIHTFAGSAITNHTAAAELSQREADSAKAVAIPEKTEREKLIEATAMLLIYSGDNKKTVSEILDEFAKSVSGAVTNELVQYYASTQQEQKNFVWKW